MNGYLGEVDVAQEDSAFAKFTRNDWALYIVRCYGGIDGDHHKQWVLDQVARILNGAPVLIRQARWKNGHAEYRISVGTCDAYDAWVKAQKDGEDGPDTYSWTGGIAPWDEGIAP